MDKHDHLSIGDEFVMLRLATMPDDEAPVHLPVGVRKLSGEFLRHAPPTPYELEMAIATIEDAIMAAMPRLRQVSELAIADADIAGIVAATGMAGEGTVTLSLDAIERTYRRLADVAHGMPASRAGIPEDALFAARLLILRELMHHVGYEHLAVMR